ncbi:hypothetical protein RHSIM_Rhsim10G0139000 [Rhododendron simsii]|uniref:Cytochrome P450 n=1 Tax=Rhododendron simsii TaxID=118357 RepID=A0A834GI01_RHOSS|nr:hypothetical protein RHSIM_Rhsim10G0139000 [Rhododendron simsii]
MGDQVMILKTLAWASVTLILYSVVRLVYDIWWKPKSIEKKLKQQGIKGNSYKLLYGDFKEIVRVTKEAWSKPMALNHRIVPRVKPFIQAMVQKYGKISLSWSKTRPNLIIADPELMRSILNDKSGDFQKPPVNPLVDLLTLGVSTLEGEKWAKRRRLITPAFHHHKLQVSMVLNEVLRLYPPVTSILRHTQRTTTIEGVSVPAGVDISLPTILLHYDPKYWGDDAEEFKPERFAEGVWKASKDQNAFYPFGWGPRFCLGQSFAITEAKLALAMLLQHFSFELSPSYTHAPYTVITLQPQHGAAIILHRI